jgi:recombination protein RecA
MSSEAARSDAELARWAGLDLRGVRRGVAMAETPAEWTLPVFVGRFGEISGDESGASLSLVFRLVLEAQRQQEPVAWVGRRDSVFFAPDVAETGVDLAALPVIWTPDVLAAARATDHLLRSGAFGLVVIDLGARAVLPIHVQTRLVGLAKKHDAALLCLTEKESERPSLGSLVSLRAHAVRAQRVDDRFCCEARVIKDKRRGPNWRHMESYRGPDGLH